MVQNRHVLLKQNQTGAKSKAVICPFAVKLIIRCCWACSWIIRNKPICCLGHCFITTRIIINTHFNTSSIKSVTRSYSSSKTFPKRPVTLSLEANLLFAQSPHKHLYLAIDLLQLEIRLRQFV
jgi:hypothetical protein